MKTIFTAVLLGLMIFPSFSYAQVAVPQVELTAEARNQLIAEITAKINLLLQELLIALMAEMKTIGGAQTAQTTTLNAIQTSVDTVVTNTTPVVVPVIEVPKPKINVGTTNCKINASATGEYTYGVVYINRGAQLRGGMSWKKPLQDSSSLIWNYPGTFPYEAYLYLGGSQSPSDVYDGELVATSTGEIAVECN